MYKKNVSEDVSIEFRLTGAGWGDLLLQFGPKSFVLEGVSNTTDALGDLLRAALMIATGAWTARASFDREPCEWRLIIGSVFDPAQWRRGFWVRVFEFPDIYKNLPDEQGDLAFEAQCDERSFTEAVLNAAKRFQEVYGPQEYDWGNNPFPLRAQRALETALTVTDMPLPPPDPNAT